MPHRSSVPPQARLRPVLIVDDSEDDLFMARRTVEHCGVLNPIITFESGFDAKDFLRHAIDAAGPDPLPLIVFTDLKMPQMSGIDLIRWARADSRFNPVRFVILSTSSQKRDRDASKAAGADDFLVKFPAEKTISEIISLANGHSPASVRPTGTLRGE